MVGWAGELRISGAVGTTHRLPAGVPDETLWVLTVPMAAFPCTLEHFGQKADDSG